VKVKDYQAQGVTSFTGMMALEEAKIRAKYQKILLPGLKRVCEPLMRKELEDYARAFEAIRKYHDPKERAIYLARQQGLIDGMAALKEIKENEVF